MGLRSLQTRRVTTPARSMTGAAVTGVRVKYLVSIIM